MKTVAMHPQGARWAERRYEMHDAIHDRTEFRNAGNTIRGEWHDYLPSTGRLPDDELKVLRKAFRGKEPHVYIVWSYATPIGWWTESDGWYIPDTKYSVTTTRHQGVLRRGSGDAFWRNYWPR